MNQLNNIINLFKPFCCCSSNEDYNEIYFTKSLDYCWFYGGTVDNRNNMDTVPNVDDTFTLIASFVYYDKNGFRRIVNNNYDPKKNEINFAYAGNHFETIPKSDQHKFCGNEYIINDLNQICPFIGVKMKRNEFCVIWRDTNFSSNPVYFNEYDQKFKTFLNNRKNYIEKRQIT